MKIEYLFYMPDVPRLLSPRKNPLHDSYISLAEFGNFPDIKSEPELIKQLNAEHFSNTTTGKKVYIMDELHPNKFEPLPRKAYFVVVNAE